MLITRLIKLIVLFFIKVNRSHKECNINNTEEVDKLLKYGVLILILKERALHITSKECLKDIIDLLLENKANVNLMIISIH
jgi:hypothetical protein